MIVLPPQEAPKGLTASYRAQNLEEHAAAFLNATNQRGWAPENFNFDVPIDGPLAEVLLEIAELRTIGLIAFKVGVQWLHKKYLGRAVKLHQVYEMIARLLGYPNYTCLRAVSIYKMQGIVVNYRSAVDVRAHLIQLSKPVE